MRRAAWVLVWTAVLGLQIGSLPEARADLAGHPGSQPIPALPQAPASDPSPSDSRTNSAAFLTPDELAYFQSHPGRVRLAAAHDPVPIEGFWWETVIGALVLVGAGVGIWLWVRNQHLKH